MDGQRASKFATQVLKQFDIMYHIRLPVIKHYVKKNSRPILINRRTNTPFLGKNQELQEAERYLVVKFQDHARKIDMKEPLDEPIWAIFFFHFTEKDFYTQKGVMRKTIGDLSNLYQLPEDCLEKAGIIANDTLIMAHDFSRRLPSKDTELEVYLLKYTNPKMAHSIGEEINPMTSNINLTDIDY